MRVALGKWWLAVAGIAAACVLSGAQDKSFEWTRGERLFSGAEGLAGRLYTHTEDMPPKLVRCANCHAAADGPAVARSKAPRLTSQHLRERKQRRGGPASNYGEQSFCALLKTGVDPAYIVIDLQMPRYRLDDAQCGALWQFLTEER